MKFEYADLYRFLVSAGIVLLALSFLAPWLLLREPLDVLYSVQDQKMLTEKSQELLFRKQDTLSWALGYISWFSTALIMLGSFLASYGGWGWFKLQKIRDKKESIGLEREEHELATMTAVEKNEKMQSEVAEEFDGNVSAKDQASFMQSYEALERKVAQRLSDVVGSTHNVLRNRKAGTSFIDILLEPKTGGRLALLQKHYLIEVKVRRRIYTYSDIKLSYIQLQKAASEYSNSTNVNPKWKLLIVVQEHERNSERMDKIIESLNEEFKPSGTNCVVVMSKADLDSLSDTDFSRRMGL